MSSGSGSPRRRRSSSDDEDRGGLPMVPLFAGVIIAGLGIGALLSAFAARHVPAPAKSATQLVVMHTPTPIAAVTQAQTTATPAPTPTPTRTSSPKPTATPKQTATPKPSPSPTATPASKPTATPSQTEKPKASAAPTAVATIARTATPLPARTPPPTVAPTAAAVAAQSSPAQALVRRFLEAVAHGDDATAYGTLADGGTPLGEAQFLDPTMRITSMTAGHAPGGGTNVQVEFRTSRGEYFGTFVVDNATLKITQREVIPVGGTTAR